MDAKGRSPQSSRAAPISNFVDEPTAVVVVNYRTSTLTKECIAALEIERPAFRNLRAVVVDGGSADGSAEALAAWIKQDKLSEWVDLIALPVNGGFGWANNQAIQGLMQTANPPQYIHVLNPDTKIEAGAVSSLAKFLRSNPHVAAVGSQLLETDGTPSGSAFSFPSVRGEFSRGARTRALERILKIPSVSIDALTPMEVDWVTGASVMIRAAALRDVGLFDEGFFLYYEEIELMWRLRKAGWTIATEPHSRVRHIGGVSTGMHDRDPADTLGQRNPSYVYRSRSRFFGLTRGRAVAIMAFASWLAGYAVWRVRHLLGVGSGKPLGDRFKDHLLVGFPRHQDFEAAAPSLDGKPTIWPAWMEKMWL